MHEVNASAEVGPSGNPTDGLPLDFGAHRVYILLCVDMYLNQMYRYVFSPVCDNYISLCMDMYLNQMVACNITKVFV